MTVRRKILSRSYPYTFEMTNFRGQRVSAGTQKDTKVYLLQVIFVYSLPILTANRLDLSSVPPM